jgi:hypothetical protein
MSHHLFHTPTVTTASASNSQLDESNATDASEIENMSMVDLIKRKLITDTCHGITERTKVLNLHSQKPVDFMHESFGEVKLTGKKPYFRSVPSAPERILDAPDFKNDYCEFIYL